jgi:cell division septum initiation protein DivIVA
MDRDREVIEKELAVARSNLDSMLKQRERMLKSGGGLPLDLALKVEELEQRVRALKTELASTPQQKPEPATPPATPTNALQSGEPAEEKSKESDFLRSQLKETRDNLRLIEERKAQYVLQVDVPLQLIKEERRLRDRIAELERKL